MTLDPSIRMSELIVLSAGVALLAAVGLVLVRAGHATGGTKAYLITLGVVSVALSWAMVHTVFTLDTPARTTQNLKVASTSMRATRPRIWISRTYRSPLG